MECSSITLIFNISAVKMLVLVKVQNWWQAFGLYTLSIPEKDPHRRSNQVGLALLFFITWNSDV